MYVEVARIKPVVCALVRGTVDSVVHTRRHHLLGEDEADELGMGPPHPLHMEQHHARIAIVHLARARHGTNLRSPRSC